MDWNYIIEKIESETGKSIAKEVGCRSQYISDLKSGKSKNPGADFVLKLMDHFKLNYEWLLTGKGELFISTVKQTVDISYRIPLLRQSVSCGTGQNWEDADVVEVKYGYWEIVKGSNGKEKMVCTNCRHQQDLHSTFTYCPNCGALIDGRVIHNG